MEKSSVVGSNTHYRVPNSWKQRQHNLLSHTEQDTNGTHLVRVCACVYHSILPSAFADQRGRGCLPRTGNILPHLCLDAAAAGQGCVVRPGSLRSHGVRTSSTLTSTNRQSPGHGPGVQCRAIRITAFRAKRFRSSAMASRMYSEAASGHGRWAVRWPVPNQSTRFG